MTKLSNTRGGEGVLRTADLKPYEDLKAVPYFETGGYVITLRASLLVHRKHTPKDVFIPHSVFATMQITDMPSKEFLKEWMVKARESIAKLIDKGEYQDEAYIAGKFQNVTRQFNKWIFWDKNQEATIGTFKSVEYSHKGMKVRL